MLLLPLPRDARIDPGTAAALSCPSQAADLLVHAQITPSTARGILAFSEIE